MVLKVKFQKVVLMVVEMLQLMSSNRLAAGLRPVDRLTIRGWNYPPCAISPLLEPGPLAEKVKPSSNATQYMTEDFNSAKVRLNGAADESEGALKVEIKRELLQQFKCATKHTEDVRNCIVSRGTIVIANIIIAPEVYYCSCKAELHNHNAIAQKHKCIKAPSGTIVRTDHRALSFRFQVPLSYVLEIHRQCKSKQHCINSLVSLVIWCQ